MATTQMENRQKENIRHKSDGREQDEEWQWNM